MNKRETTAIPIKNNRQGQGEQKRPDQRPLVLLVLGLILLAADLSGSVLFPAGNTVQTSSRISPDMPEYIWLTGPEIEEGVYRISGPAATPSVSWLNLYQGLGLIPPPDGINCAPNITDLGISGLTAVHIQSHAHPVFSPAPPLLGAFFFKPIPINRADRELLEVLPGIGPKLADRIISFRENRGKIIGPDELMLVSGISRKKLHRLHGAISFE